MGEIAAGAGSLALDAALAERIEAAITEGVDERPVVGVVVLALLFRAVEVARAGEAPERLLPGIPMPAEEGGEVGSGQIGVAG